VKSANAIHAPIARPFDVLDEWVDAGLITREQADRIEAYQSARRDRRPRVTLAPALPASSGRSLVVEALGYLGGVIMLVGAGLLVGLYWAGIPVALRLVLIAVTATALIGAGLAVPDHLG
jgi:hypothetical protein